MAKLRFALSIFFAAFLVYGFFFPHLPVVNADELWETSRAYHLQTHLHPGEPIIPKEVSPFYASIEEMGWQGWFLGTAKLGSFALAMKLLPVNQWIAMRLTMFCWSLLVCLLTYLMARRFKLSASFSTLAVALLLFFPDFFSQIHRERAELLITAALLAGVLLMMKAKDEKEERKKSRLYLIAGIYAWIPSFLVHPSAIIIPGVMGLIYLITEWKRFKHVNTLLIGIGLMAGAFFFLYLMNSIREFADASGGGNYFNYQGPPVLVKGLRYIPTIPLAFYKKFTAINLLSRPFSFMIFCFAFALLFYNQKKKSGVFTNTQQQLLTICIFGSLLLLFMFSGSFGNYNVIVAPFVMIIFASCISNWYGMNKEKLALAVSFLLLFGNFAVIAMNVPSDIKYAKEFKSMNVAVHNVIPEKETGIMGLALYYLPFKERRFYSNSWFNQYAGIPGQTFEEAVRILNVHYVIVDDAFVGRAVLDRGLAWTDSMMLFLNSNGKIILEKKVNLWVGNRVPNPAKYPLSWKYPELETSFIHRLRVYELN